MQHAFKLLALLLFLPVLSLEAAPVTQRACLVKLIQMVNESQNKEKAFPLNLYEIKLDKPVDHIFGERTLKPVPKNNRTTLPLYQRPTPLKIMNKLLFTETKFIPDLPTDQFTSLMVTDAKYTYIIQDNKMTLARTGKGITDYTSKHAIMSAIPEDGPIHLGGEMWKDKNGVFHFDPASGTFVPTNEDLKKGEVFFKDYMGIKKYEAHPYYPPAPSLEAPAPSLSLKDKVVEKFKELTPSKFNKAKKPLQSGLKSQVNSFNTHSLYGSNGDIIVMRDESGAEDSYRMEQLNSFMAEETTYKSVGPGGSMIKTITYAVPEVAKPELVMPTEEVHKNTTYRPVQNKKTLVIQMGFFPVNAPKGSETPSFVASFEKSSGISAKEPRAKIEYHLAVEDNTSEGEPRLQQVEKLTKKIEEKFKLLEVQGN